MPDLTAAEARTRLKPFEEGLAALIRILDVAARAEHAEGQALLRTQDAERRIAQAALRVGTAEQAADLRVKEADERAQKALDGLQARLGEKKAALDGQVARLEGEVAAGRQRLEQVGQELGRAERDRDALMAGYRQKAEALKRGLEEQTEELKRAMADLESRIAAKRGEYRDIVEKIQAIKV